MVSLAQSRYEQARPGATRRPIQLRMNEAQYNAFLDALNCGAETSSRTGKGHALFRRLLPIEVMPERGRETLRFRPMKPVGHDQSARPHW